MSSWLTRHVLLRLLGFVFLGTFLTSALQTRSLFGPHGLSPASPSNRPVPAFHVLQWLGIAYSELALELLSWLGVFLALLLLLDAFAHFTLPLALWCIQLSLVNLGSHYVMGYGWEWQILEVTLLAVFLSPLLPWRSTLSARREPVHELSLWLIRCCAFRVMWGAGMSKLGGIFAFSLFR